MVAAQSAIVAQHTKSLSSMMCLMLAAWLTACSPEQFDRPGDGGNETLYTAIYPYYAEYCALSQIKKKVGFGADIRGEAGGHSVFFLNGACRDTTTDYPVLSLCQPSPTAGVGISVNEHFRNAKWVAIPGRNFFFDGNLARDHGLSREDYVRAKAEAAQLGIYRGVVFQSWVFDDKPDSLSREDWKYEVSIATDYAISFGRGRFCARVPVNRAQMARMIDFLNAQNEPYRYGKEIFKWSVFQDNCTHLAHNALAVAGVWPDWPINMPLPVAILDFPVPKNEFVNLMRRVNDPPDLDLATVYHDDTAVRSLTAFGRLPWQPGVVAEARPPQSANQVYDTDLEMLFYDDPITGRYRTRLDAIFRDPRYHDIGANVAYFAGLYRQLDADRRPLAEWLTDDEFRAPAARQAFTEFYDHFYAYVDQERVAIDAYLNRVTTVAPGAVPLSPLAQAAAR